MKKFRTHSNRMALGGSSAIVVLLWLLPPVLCAAIRQVPGQYPTVKAAYAAAQSGDIIEMQPNAYLESPAALFDHPSKTILFRPASGRTLLTANIPPVNDTFFDRTDIFGTSLTIRTDNYTAAVAPEPGEPLPHKNTLLFDPASFVRGIWFQWTAPVSGLTIVNAVGSDFTTVVDVFRGVSYPPTRLDTEVVWNSNFNEVGFIATAGVRYQILVGGYNAANGYGEISLSVTVIEPPANDHFATSHTITGALAQVIGSSFSATSQNPEPSHAQAAAGYSVWFKWTAPAGEGIAPRPARLTTGGSDFDTVLAVYEGTFGELFPVASNDDTVSDYSSALTFTPTPGSLYHIAIDGSTSLPFQRRQQGNYLLRVDYSVVDMVAEQVRAEPPDATRRVNFQADLALRDWGFAPTGPLRVRLSARFGRDHPGVHRASASRDSTLAVFTDFASNGFQPAESKLLTVSGICPPPPVMGGVYGVFAVLEEFFATNWITIDQTFLLYGYSTESSLPIISYGAGRPVPAQLAANEVNQVLGVGVRVLNYVTENSTNRLGLVVQLDNGREGAVNNGSWSGPGWANLSGNGFLTIGDISQSTSLVVTGRYNLGGVARTSTDTVPIYKRPRLTLMPTATRDGFQYVVECDFAAAFSLEYKNTVDSPAWQFHNSGFLNSFLSTNTLVGTDLNQRFYRLKLQP